MMSFSLPNPSLSLIHFPAPPPLSSPHSLAVKQTLRYQSCLPSYGDSIHVEVVIDWSAYAYEKKSDIK